MHRAVAAIVEVCDGSGREECSLNTATPWPRAANEERKDQGRITKDRRTFVAEDGRVGA